MSYEWHPQKYNAQMRQGVVANLWRAGFLVEADAKKLCPVDKGFLRSSLITNVDERRMVARIGSGTEILESLTGSNIYYGPFVEFGTRFKPARPFLTPALEMNKREILSLLRRGLPTTRLAGGFA